MNEQLKLEMSVSKGLYEKVKRLEAENKRLVGASEHILEHIKPLKESRNKLLSACKLLSIEKHDPHIHAIIQDAEALKDKEA